MLCCTFTSNERWNVPFIDKRRQSHEEMQRHTTLVKKWRSALTMCVCVCFFFDDFVIPVMISPFLLLNVCLSFSMLFQWNYFNTQLFCCCFIFNIICIRGLCDIKTSTWAFRLLSSCVYVWHTLRTHCWVVCTSAKKKDDDNNSSVNVNSIWNTRIS